MPETTPNIFVSGVKKNATDDELSPIIKATFLKATDNVSWLKPGETVLLKPALNSPDPYPSTTHPLSIKAVAEILSARGAQVVVGDQSGIGYVLQDATGVKQGSSRKNFEVSGMKDGSDVRFVGFEEEDWNNGFSKFKTDQTASWPDGFYVTDWINKADHIVSLPRLSTHAQAGVTLGFKNLVGILREDSRLVFHANGPYNAFIKGYAKFSDLAVQDDGSNTFFEKMTEISLAVKHKLRLTLFTATKAQTTFGPDRNVVPLFKNLLASYVMTPETGLVFASADQVAAEVFAMAFLTYLYSKTPFSRRLLQKLLLVFNGQAKELGTYKIRDNPFVNHALKLGLGHGTIMPEWNQVHDNLIKNLTSLFS